MDHPAIRKRIRVPGRNLTKYADRFERLDDSNFVGDYPDVELAKSFLENLLEAGEELGICSAYPPHPR
jgi:hypothetical protein